MTPGRYVSFVSVQGRLEPFELALTDVGCVDVLWQQRVVYAPLVGCSNLSASTAPHTQVRQQRE